MSPKRLEKPAQTLSWREADSGSESKSPKSLVYVLSTTLAITKNFSSTPSTGSRATGLALTLSSTPNTDGGLVAHFSTVSSSVLCESIMKKETVEFCIKLEHVILPFLLYELDSFFRI